METIIFGIKLAFGLVIGLIVLFVGLIVLLGLICRVILFFGELFKEEKQEEITLGSGAFLPDKPDIIYAKKHEADQASTPDKPVIYSDQASTSLKAGRLVGSFLAKRIGQRTIKKDTKS